MYFLDPPTLPAPQVPAAKWDVIRSIRVATFGFICFLAVFCNVKPAHAAVVFQATHFYAFGGDPKAVEIDVKVIDNFNGDFTKYLWQYTVKNNSFDPNPGTSNGLSGLELALPVPTVQTPPDIGNVSAPSPSWIINCCSGEPVEWDKKVGPGILPGQQGVFSFTSLPRTPTGSNGWFHTWEHGGQSNVTFYTAGDGPEVPNVSLARLVDPVSSPILMAALSKALTGIVDGGIIASRGNVVTGVSADGVTQVLVNVGASVKGEKLRLTLLGDPSTDGSISALTSKETGSSVVVPAYDTTLNPGAFTLGPMAFAIYHAPKDFARPGTNDDTLASRNVTIQIQSLKTGAVFTLPVTIVRPPLALIHGIWSNYKDAWNNFGVRVNNQFTRLSDDQRFNTLPIDYQSTNGDGFAANAGIVKGQIDVDVDAFKNGNNRQSIKVAAVQVDIVAHSMGGDLARTMVTRQDYLVDNNYHKGLIHKLITIDTPHLGSEFVDRLYNSNFLCRTIFGKIKKVGDAVKDLRTTSDNDMIQKTLRQKIFPLAVSTINGVATPAQAHSAELNFGNLLATPVVGPALLPCFNLLPFGGFSAVFPQDTSDLIVAGNSQKAIGLGYDGADPPTTASEGVIHAIVPPLFTKGPEALSSDSMNPQKVIGLLNTPIDSAGFGKILP